VCNAHAATVPSPSFSRPGHGRRKAASPPVEMRPISSSVWALAVSIEDASHEAIGELRAILGVLRDGDSSDAPRAPAPGVENIAELVQRAHDAGLEGKVDIDGERPARVSDAVSLAAYRIVQESLTNARRHAAGAVVRVHFGFDATRLSIAVENGPGARPSGNGATAGIGIAGMLERASAIGGTLRAAPTQDGFRVEAELPYELSR
jgi:signal transduction histidine kinase